MGNNNRNAKLLAECLQRISAGEATLEECVAQYPHLKAELLLANQMRSYPEGSPRAEQIKQKRMIRARVMQKLPDRDLVVTKSGALRYRGQNLKRRFAMSWIIILTTLISLVSGGGVVYASGNALPGDTLYPVKTWVEDVRLAAADDEADVGLHFRFAETRLEEIDALIGEGDYEGVEEAFSGYENHVQLLTQLMTKIQAQDPDEAIRLRTDLQTKLQEQSRIMESMLDDAEDSDAQLRDRLREMLQTNTQLRERINFVEDEIATDEAVSEESEVETSEDNPSNGAGNGKQQGNGNISANIDSAANAFTFNMGGQGGNGVYAMIDGTRFECAVDGDKAVCPAAGAPNKGSVQLYDGQTNQLLYTYAYEFAFSHTWQGENDGNGQNGGSGMEDGEGGGKNSGK